MFDIAGAGAGAGAVSTRSGAGDLCVLWILFGTELGFEASVAGVAIGVAGVPVTGVAAGLV